MSKNTATGRGSSRTRAKAVLKQERGGTLPRFHPWIFSGALADIQGSPREGDLIDVFLADRCYYGTGHYGEGSIAVRLLSFQPLDDEDEYLRRRLQAAVCLRRSLGLWQAENTNAFRLFNAEGDGTPGLTIDWYDGTAVLQCHSAGVLDWRDKIVRLLKEITGRLDSVVDRTPAGGENAETAPGEVIFGGRSDGVIKENGLLFSVDCAGGQKTGFYLDQRENREIVRTYASGRSVLNAFCYTGGFTAYALAGGAARVKSVDISRKSLEKLEANVALNFSAASSEVEAADCLEYLKNQAESFDMIILDPPAFVKHRGALRGGTKGYDSINFHALRTIAAGGLLFTFSCSQFVDRALFRLIVQKAAVRAGRQVRILRELRQSACHPVSIFHPEGEYLKGLLLLVD